jgi:hypothetical protein
MGTFEVSITLLLAFAMSRIMHDAYRMTLTSE